MNMLGLCLSLYMIYIKYDSVLLGRGSKKYFIGEGRKIALADLYNNIGVLGFYQDEYYLLEFIRRRQKYFTSHKDLIGHSRLPEDSYPFHSLRTFATFPNFLSKLEPRLLCYIDGFLVLLVFGKCTEI